ELQGQRITRVNLQRMRNAVSGFGVASTRQRFACLASRGLSFMWRLQLIRRNDGLVLRLHNWSWLPHRRSVVHLCGNDCKREGRERSQEKPTRNCLPPSAPFETLDAGCNQHSHKSKPCL